VLFVAQRRQLALRDARASPGAVNAQCQKNASSRMIGSGIPMSQSSAPFPNDMYSLQVED
jgi:hypothetical protein